MTVRTAYAVSLPVGYGQLIGLDHLHGAQA